MTLADGTEWPARLVGAAPDQDLAVLRIQAPDDKPAPLHLGSPKGLRVGQFPMATCKPSGLYQTPTTCPPRPPDRDVGYQPADPLHSASPSRARQGETRRRRPADARSEGMVPGGPRSIVEGIGSPPCRRRRGRGGRMGSRVRRRGGRRWAWASATCGVPGADA